MPVRDGQHVCCFCGSRHFYTAVPVTVIQGCYRTSLARISRFNWLATAPCDEWRLLILSHRDKLAAARLGKLSRVLVEALSINHWADECTLDGTEWGVLLKSYARIAVRNGHCN
eukprot:6487405-Amphidinium_carterae.1